ncbi:MAG: hypothetical protein A2521_06605 [Deltaproteobacteria bacterium RIFOXYD12_FULL_57_12]|nr:MAG: hypothetical protein A2521_06605 [Deltaproteobacteria bacterium RIFOXYD12_FULL_57_12]
MDNDIGRMISSKEILLKTGISRATLNNYIKMRILPRPIVQKAGADQAGAKRIGYFPHEVLERIAEVRRLKRAGANMGDIVRVMSAPEAGEKFEPVTHRTSGVLPFALNSSDSHQKDENLKHELKLTAHLTDSVGYLINSNLEIIWLNRLSEEFFFHENSSGSSGIEARKIFTLFATQEVRASAKDLKALFMFHLAMFKAKISKSFYTALCKRESGKEWPILEEIYEETDSCDQEVALSKPHQFVLADGSMKYYQIHAMSFVEGVFFVYLPCALPHREPLGISERRDNIVNGMLLGDQKPSLVSLCVLSAVLQDSIPISVELPPEEYFELINDLWTTVGTVLEKYNGISNGQGGAGLFCFFLIKSGSSYAKNAIDCALELKMVMREFSRKWSGRKNWRNEFFLNLGISAGQEYFGVIRSGRNVEFTAQGETINCSYGLSLLARSGSIWASKSVISCLTPEERGSIRFGISRKIHERDVIIPNAFSRVADLQTDETNQINLSSDIASLPITEILENQ